MRRFSRVLGLCAILCVSSPALAQSLDQQWTSCDSKDEKLPQQTRIDACTAVIQSGQFDSKKMAAAFRERGIAYQHKGDTDQAISDYSRAIQLDPQYAKALFARGYAYIVKKDYDRAIADFDAAIRSDPQYADAYFDRGAAYEEKKSYDSAISDYSKAIELKPQDPDGYYNRGKAYQRKGDNDRAIADYDHAIQLNPRLADAYNNRGAAYEDKGDHARAIADYNRATEIDPKDVDPYLNRGNVYVHIGNYEQAIAEYGRAIALFPQDAKLYFARGTAYQDKGDSDRAIADYDRAIKLNPQYSSAYNNRGNSWLAKNQYMRAVADFDRAIELDPQDAMAYNNRGNAYLFKADYDRAIADYGRAIEANPQFADAYNGRGVAYHQKGDDDLAIADYTRAIQLNPQYAKARENLRAASAGRTSASGAASLTLSSPSFTAKLAPLPIFQSTAGASATGPRIALVIGVGAYGTLGNLANPPNDAKLLALALQQDGFDVELVVDADLRTFHQAVTHLGERMAAAGSGATGLFFFAGHGVQSKGINYLIPSRASISREADLELEAVPADAILAQMEEAGVSTNILILDACRNTPFGRNFRGGARGLAQMDAPNGSFIAYSTAPGAVAADGAGDDSPFAGALARELGRTGEPIEAVFRNVRRAVLQETDGQQTPWDSSSLVEPFYFKG